MSVKIQRTFTLLLLAVITAVTLCSFTLFNSDVETDTVKNRVYKFITADSLRSDLRSDSQGTQNRLNGEYVLLSGLFENSDSKSVTIMDESYKSIVCTFDRNADINTNFSFKDKTAVYGKLTFSFGNPELSEVRKVIKAPSVRSSDMYFTLDGSSFDKAAATERTLCNGRVKYFIPSSWNKIEADITINGLGTIEGRQYVLNKIPGRESETPESLFICWFDKEMLKNKSDIKSTELVEKAIVKNITPDEKIVSFPSASVTTYYKAKYHYYTGKYQRAAGQPYRTEYIFCKDGDNGLIMFLYLYPNDNKYSSDVLFATRFTEVK